MTAEVRPTPHLEELVDVVRDRGGRVSAARMSILEVVTVADGPLTCEEITSRIRRGTISSVKRFLSTLEEWGLARHSHLGYRVIAYTLGDAETLPRYAVCQDCERAIPLPRDMLWPLEVRLRETMGFTADFVHTSITGVCRACEAASPASSTRPRFAHGHF